MTETELTIARRLATPRSAVWRAWENPRLLEEWFCPRPWRAEVTGFELRPGGPFDTVMSGPAGEIHAGKGCFLEVVPEERIVFTSLMEQGFRPAAACDLPMTAIITLAEAGDATRYTARVLHATAEDTRRHAEMGFEPGWGAAIAQLEEVARRLSAAPD